MLMIRQQQAVINGDGTYSRDFTYIDNVVHANEQAALSQNPGAGGQAFNIAYGGNISLNELYAILKDNLAQYDDAIGLIDPIYGPERPGDIPHSMASIDKARELLNYQPQYDARAGFEKACKWYRDHSK